MSAAQSNSYKKFDALDIQTAAITARADLYFFSMWMFLRRKGYRWLRAPHHKIICDALMRVFNGECKRLILNIPPRYSKTELAVINFIAWAMGKVPDSEFIHVSYSSDLAANNSANTKFLMLHEAYQEIFPDVKFQGTAQAHWKTTAGGVMYSAGAGGTLTGFGAGKHREGFGGCFPYEQLVETEIGPVAIGDLVTQQMPVRVWSWNEKGGRAELMPVDTFWTNPANEILEVGLPDGSIFRCTPNHRLLTASGWVEAVHLAQSLDLVEGKPSLLRSLLAGLRRIGGNLNDAFGVLGLKAPRRLGQLGGHAGPCLTKLDLPDDAKADPVAGGDDGRRVGAGENLHGLVSGKLCAGSPVKQRECAVPDGILHVVGLGAPGKIAKRVVSTVAIQMARFVRFWSRASKGFEHQVGDVSHRHLPANGEVNAKVSLAVVAGLEHAQREIPSDLARVGYCIEPISAGYVKPRFVRAVGRVDATFCLEVRSNHNFILAQSGAIVSNCIIIDDPHKASEARSDTIRKGVLDWFQTTLESRKNDPKNTPIILIMQRLHENDLAGWLQENGNGEDWETICLPAIQEDGAALWPEKHSIEDLRRMEQANPYVFAGQYMQRPSPGDGGLFKPEQIQIIDAAPALITRWCRGWDFASTTDGDFTAGAKIGRMDDGRFFIADMVRLRTGPDERDAAIKNTADHDGRGVTTSIPQDPGQAGKTQVAYMTRMLAGHKVKSSPESGDKVTRAEPFAAQVNVGNVLMVRGPWNEAYINELRMFPNGTFDDQVDASSRAFAEVMAPRKSFFG